MKHAWKTQRRGGDPAEEGSYERVTYCQACGIELDEDNRDAECEDEPTRAMGN